MRALVLAGGQGRRLQPFTSVFPKPLAPVGEMPIVEIVLRQLAAHGFREATISIGYLGHLVQAYFATMGEIPGLAIDYLPEKEPLGTVGPAALLPPDADGLLTINGDVLCDVDFAAFAEAFRRDRPALAVAVHPRPEQIDFGVVEVGPGGDVRAWVEKPRTEHLCSMGINILSPEAVAAIEPGERLDVPDLVRRLIGRGQRVVAWRCDGYWLDIGRRDDYERAQAEFDAVRDRILPAGPRSGPAASPAEDNGRR